MEAYGIIGLNENKRFAVISSGVRPIGSNLSPDWWRKNDAISRLQSCEFPDFVWGLAFKTEDSRMNQEYPQGSTCWFFHVEVANTINNYCATHPWEVIDLALASTIEILEEVENKGCNLCNWDLLLDRLREIQRQK